MQSGQTVSELEALLNEVKQISEDVNPSATNAQIEADKAKEILEDVEPAITSFDKDLDEADKAREAVLALVAQAENY